MKSSMWIVGTAVAMVLLTSCGPPTLDDIKGRSFSSVSDFQDAVPCSEHFSVFPHWADEPPTIETEAEALEMATTLLDEAQPRVTDAIQAGEVWVFVDGDGFAFAAMETVGASIGGCSGY